MEFLPVDLSPFKRGAYGISGIHPHIRNRLYMARNFEVRGS